MQDLCLVRLSNVPLSIDLLMNWYCSELFLHTFIYTSGQIHNYSGNEVFKCSFITLLNVDKNPSLVSCLFNLFRPPARVYLLYFVSQPQQESRVMYIKTD